MTGKDKDDLIEDWMFYYEGIKDPKPAQLEAFFEAYSNFMASYSDQQEEAEPQAD